MVSMEEGGALGTWLIGVLSKVWEDADEASVPCAVLIILGGKVLN